MSEFGMSQIKNNNATELEQLKSANISMRAIVRDLRSGFRRKLDEKELEIEILQRQLREARNESI